ncbi:LysR family transcriptional regulator [Capnocytophaga sp. Marseille-Q4570]|jgi:transcriptional regulator, lysR family|uniref:LysR family transcriptional regulator n=1 Tax=Capnocytophaga bilenii TaxID=2819369 RepID=A0ABS3PZT4_9FLAO|nr:MULTISPECIES: hydrogen peroxide-inducible genes activator [Capnocytophaga]EKY07252.1 LysR substrate binding domain protein [Capnocytophaga sp. oral taxon 332 str. F0381]MBO1884389.1 LysR family transcriptional regulator [Capnocytophaga bilenii]
MTITQFQYVLAVAKYKNFTTAAEHSFVTQPTLSMQIQKLEEELGVIIFDRSKKPLQITEVGERIVKQAQVIVNESERMNDIVAQEKGFIGGEFRVGIIPTVSPTLLPMFLTNFIKKYPKVCLKIEEQTTENILKKIADGSYDAGILATPLHNPNIIEKPLYYEPFVAYIPVNHRLQNAKTIYSEDLDINDILMLEDGHCFKDSVLNICNQDIIESKQHFQLKSGSFETLVRLANEGLGMTLLPYLHTLELKEKEKECVHYFVEPYPAREISLIYHKNELKMQIIKALHDTISGVIRGAIAFQNVKIISPTRERHNI